VRAILPASHDRSEGHQVDDCTMCAQLLSEPEGGWVLRHGGWAALVYPGHEVPGSIVVALERHAEGIAELDRTEAEEYGVVAWRLARALQAATDSERVYLAAFGESVPHFHFLAAARTEDVDHALRGPGFVLAKDQMRDPEAAQAVAERIRAALAADGLSTPGLVD
jgi:diadenosine tetraphosphate (Ap4A) HIT family hydrolase